MLKRILLLSVMLMAMAAAWAWHAYQQALHRQVVTDGGKAIEIERGDSFRAIVAKLQIRKIDIDPFWFKVIAYQRKVAHKLKAGEYELVEGMTMPDLLALFVSGKTRQYAITIPEGWTFKQIQQSLAENPNLEHRLTATEPQAIMSQLGIEQQHPEGWFFPETYFFEKHSTDLQLLKRAYEKMRVVLHREWQERDENLPLQTPYEALILASIVEKETAKVEERPQIAGVFIRRLRKGMLLQTDPTVIYGMGDRYRGNIQAKDLKEPTPYNTYVIKGLPPTPIAMPGRQAIHAVLHPSAEGSLYFVARGDGSHVFSASLREHVNAVNKYQKRRP
ncbi:endolytic transglycosylase MltG [Methylomarinum vadi]|uniref:endolytic transglycosylase MltG n=1 Tax=Methylomarinum vadi TaxID=438855 RepID=UPI0004DFC4DF|nr:endolytic transglycosylase MltG [Methylomarinum vadi]